MQSTKLAENQQEVKFNVEEANRHIKLVGEKMEFSRVPFTINSDNENLQRTSQIVLKSDAALDWYKAIKHFQENYNFDSGCELDENFGIHTFHVELIREFFLELHFEHLRREHEFDLKHGEKI